MTVQINDRVFHRKIEFEILENTGNGLFHPSEIGITPVDICTNCWRGYQVAYAIENEQLVLLSASMGALIGGSIGVVSHDGQHELVPFTGVMLLVADSIADVRLRFFCPPSARYRIVRQVRFDEGRLIEDEDRSQEVEELRRSVQSVRGNSIMANSICPKFQCPTFDK